MEHTLGKMINRPSDYIQCNGCNSPVWYEHDECSRCGEKITTKKIMTKKEMNIFVEEEVSYYKEEGYSEEEIFSLLYDV